MTTRSTDSAVAPIRARNAVDPGSYVVALAFGPGLTLYAALLRVVSG